MGISIREYARRRDVSDMAVRKAIKQGRITKESDGTIDPNRADKAWVTNTARPQLKLTPNVTVSKDITTTLQDNDQVASSGNTFIKAKTTNEIIKAQTNKLRFKQLNGELVNKEEVCRLVFQLSRQERDAWQAWPARIASQMAAQLQIDTHTLQITLEQYIYEHLLELGNVKLDFKE